MPLDQLNTTPAQELVPRKATKSERREFTTLIGPVVQAMLSDHTPSIVVSGSVPLKVLGGHNFEIGDVDVFVDKSQLKWVLGTAVLMGAEVTPKHAEYAGTDIHHCYVVTREGSPKIEVVVCDNALECVSTFDLTLNKLAYDGKNVYTPEGWQPRFTGSTVYSAEIVNACIRLKDKPFGEFEPSPGNLADLAIFTKHMKTYEEDPYYAGVFWKTIKRIQKYQQRGFTLTDLNGNCYIDTDDL